MLNTVLLLQNCFCFMICFFDSKINGFGKVNVYYLFGSWGIKCFIYVNVEDN